MDKRTLIFVLGLSFTLFCVNLFFQSQNESKRVEWQQRQASVPSVDLSEKKEKILPPSSKEEEAFYVIETPYQQLVFSTRGGALAEINLPFHSESHPQSVVREIAFDRELAEEHPSSTLFPAHPYYTAPLSKEGTPSFHAHGKQGGYYPLLRRALRPDQRTQAAQYYALNCVSDYPETAELSYKVTAFSERSITFEAQQPHRRIVKTYTIDDEGPYCIELALHVEGETKGLWLTSGVPEAEWISGGIAPALKYRLTRNGRTEVVKIDVPKETITVSSLNLDWVCNSNGFLGTILDPRREGEGGYRVRFISGNVAPSRLLLLANRHEAFTAANLPGYMTVLPLRAQGGTIHCRLFAGPFDTAILKQVDARYADPVTGEQPDYLACQTMHGWFTFISEPFAKFLFILLNTFHALTSSWAFSIVLLTISLRIMLYPLNAWSTRSSVRMQQIAPEVSAIQERFKKDPKRAQLEVMQLYRERGINPVSGCLPLLIQMPFLIGMFDLLKSSFALRGASFIPGWIDDLTAPDVLFQWKTPLLFIGNEFHLLPVLLGLVMLAQQRLMASSASTQMTDAQRQQKAMGTIMTLVFTVMFYNFPSGLNIYWLCSMLLGILQQWNMSRRLKRQALAVPSALQPQPRRS